MLCLLGLTSADDLLEVLCSLGWNKKKSNDALILQMAIDSQATSLAPTVNEFTKPQLSTHIINLFQNYAWAATGELVLDGITPFNIAFACEGSA